MDVFSNYLDTSVISAYFDFRKPVRQLVTQQWFHHHAQSYRLFASTLVIDEISKNTDQQLMRNMLNLLNEHRITILEITEATVQLATSYREHILSKEINDTLHIATASVYQVDAIVSWNFKHIVNLRTMKEIHAINIVQGFPALERF